ncbi:MAG: glycosyltransferase family 4 protein [Candidatus Saccharibacteria bacterium]
MRLLEIMKYAPKSIKKSVLTTPNGLEFLKKYNQKYDKAYLLDQVVEGGIVSNLKISWRSFFFGRSGVKEFDGDVVYSSCEHLYDVLPALRLKRRSGARWLAVYHWVEEYPWKDNRGNTPFIPRYAYWLNRYISGWIIKHFADEILAVSDQTREKLISMKKVNPNKVRAVYCGVEYDTIRNIVDKAGKKKIYDAVFMKRLNYGKGVLDLLKIWKAVVAKNPDAKLGIIGDGSEDVLSKVKEYIKTNNLEKNIDILGVIYDMDKKFQIISSSKVFLLPTYEENWAIVIGEAMAAGVPVVVSKLKEIEPIWQDNVIWCKVGDIKSFAQATLGLINDNKKASALALKAQKFIPRYDWKNIAENEIEIKTS